MRTYLAGLHVSGERGAAKQAASPGTVFRSRPAIFTPQQRRALKPDGHDVARLGHTPSRDQIPSPRWVGVVREAISVIPRNRFVRTSCVHFLLPNSNPFPSSTFKKQLFFGVFTRYHMSSRSSKRSHFQRPDSSTGNT